MYHVDKFLSKGLVRRYYGNYPMAEVSDIKSKV